MNTNEKVIYVGSFPYKSEDGKIVNPQFESWFPYDNKTTWFGGSRLVFGDSYQVYQGCLPKEKCCQRMLPWAKRCYHQVIHFAWRHPIESPRLSEWCLCLRWPTPLRYSKELGWEYVVYLHRVGECPCMEYSSGP